jgi:hypothetical protein
MSLGLLKIILLCVFVMILGYLNLGWEENEGLLFSVFKEAQELASQCLKLQLVLLHALKHYGLDELVRVKPGVLRPH